MEKNVCQVTGLNDGIDHVKLKSDEGTRMWALARTLPGALIIILIL